MSAKEEELKIKEAVLAAVQDKSEKEHLAKEEAERAESDLRVSEQAFNDAQKAREAQQIRTEAAKKHAVDVAEEDLEN